METESFYPTFTWLKNSIIEISGLILKAKRSQIGIMKYLNTPRNTNVNQVYKRVLTMLGELLILKLMCNFTIWDKEYFYKYISKMF